MKLCILRHKIYGIKFFYMLYFSVNVGYLQVLCPPSAFQRHELIANCKLSVVAKVKVCVCACASTISVWLFLTVTSPSLADSWNGLQHPVTLKSNPDAWETALGDIQSMFKYIHLSILLGSPLFPVLRVAGFCWSLSHLSRGEGRVVVFLKCISN